ncbi:hypothetical protein BGZ51_007376 [Haplosporangium sp. Z 767]|nr:hypothetical protein BGZ51_007376 [Haplosporangium sp. Z 767]
MSRIHTVVNDLRNGLGAVKLRPDVKKVTLMFSRKSDNAGASSEYSLQEEREAWNKGTKEQELKIEDQRASIKGLRGERQQPGYLDGIPLSKETPVFEEKYFLRENLPRIQYNNPTIQFEVKKVQEPGVSPELTVEFANNDIKKIPCSRIQSSDICKQFLSATTEGSA